MPKYATAQEWLEQSSLLLKAYPTTTKITTKYNIPNASKVAKSQSRRRKAPTGDETSTTSSSLATLEVRTFNPDAGVILKYQTNKAYEVGRLMASMGRLGRHMAALPEISEDVVMADIKDEAVGSGVATPVPEAKTTTTAPQPNQQGGGGKKKKKGKR